MKKIFSKKESGYYDLITESGEQFCKEKSEPWQEYPRPQMKRDNYQILNGEWILNGKVTLVPFPPQSRLSGYEGEVSDRLVYTKTFVLSDELTRKDGENGKEMKQGRVLLHFGAVDQIAGIWVNDIFVGEHEGGYLPLYFDITDVLTEGENILKVEAVDTLSHDYPYGKQKKKRGGMWYTPVSGIWQSVWLEKVPENYVEKIKLTSDLCGVELEVFLNKKESGNRKTESSQKKKEDIIENLNLMDDKCSVSIHLHNGQTVEHVFHGTKTRVNLSDIRLEDGRIYTPKLWTPDEPYLYRMNVEWGEDRVETYFALRTINIEETDAGKRICLNGKPIFLHGVLDQGYFPEGIYLPAMEKEFEKEVLRMKELGINMLRKHIKVEPEAFYYACDRLGMLVMQDMVNSGPYSFLLDTALPTIGLKKRPDSIFAGKSVAGIKDDLSNLHTIKNRRKAFFVRHTKDTIEHLYNHPSIIAYTIFNEGWGQFCSDALYDLVKKWDPTRLIDSTSGWFSQKKNDFDSEHIYFKVIPLMVKKRPLFVSECGGYSMVVEKHHYSKDKEYGYGTCKNSEELTDKILYMYENMIVPFIKDGLCGCVYTQVSDVEDEVNGLYTYDRKVCKVDKVRMKALADAMQKEAEK